MKKLILSISCCAVFAACTTNTPEEKLTSDTNLGVLQHQFTLSEASKEDFNNGLLLLHSFEYDDAKEAFQAAILKDSNEVMAYWGEAMSNYRALWGLQDVEAGRAVMVKLDSTKERRLAKAENELEKEFWEGVEILYGEGILNERNKAYATHMGGLYEKYKGNQEVAAFYALGLMWSVDGGRDAEIFGRSAKVAEGILEENPQHPGALHYLIHANDDPDYAKLSKIAADQYANVAPDATHALHMPSHIYLALGMWNDVVSSNEASYGASVNRMERKGLDDKARGYHSYAWLHYGYLQQGRYDKAEQLLRDMHTYTASAGSRGARSYLITMQNAQLVESNNWPENLQPMMVDYIDLGLSTKASQHFFNAMLHYKNGESGKIAAEIDSLETQLAIAEMIVTEGDITICSAGPTRYAPNKSDITKSNVIVNQMKAMMALLDENEKLAESYFIKATEMEDQAEYSYGPPDIPFPSFEQYGDWLLSKNRAEDALVQYEKSLKIAPNRAKALQGKMAALEQLQKTEEAEEVQKILSTFWQQELVASN